MDDRPFLLNRNPREKQIFIEDSDCRFDDKKNTLGGIMALVIAIVSAALLVGSVAISYRARGQGEITLGIMGMAGLLLAVSGMIIAIMSYREEDRKYVLSTVSVVMNVILVLLWCGVYLIGI